MEKITVSFITTCFNEEKNIAPFLDSLLSQTKKPDEIIIVDAGSSDATVSRIDYKVSSIQYKKIPIKVITKKGNRSVGRNEAIQYAAGKIIAVSDVGCVLDKDWLKNITEPFTDEAIDVVSGFYHARTHSVFEKCLSTYTCVMPDKLDKANYLPSSRSIAFKKSVWESVGGYPEYLDTCEDLVFAQKLKDKNATFIVNEKAIVLWSQQHTITQAFLQFYHYAVGDGMARFFRWQTPFLYFRYLVGFLLLILFFLFHLTLILYILIGGFVLYTGYAINKNYRYIKNKQAFYYLPLLQYVSDVAVLIGTTVGFIKGLSISHEHR